MVNPELTDEQKRQQFEAACKTKPLKDQLPSLRAMEGFPIGTDEDILALSDPPYYTACPNPYINDFITAFGKPYDPATDDYERTPFVSDVSVGKTGAIYYAHSYHTKVPHRAIMQYIQHYTKEGDIIFDGFCGTGMTGVAAKLLKRNAILSDLSPEATFITYNYNIKINKFKFEKDAKAIFSETEKETAWMFETLHFDGVTKGKTIYTIYSDVFHCSFCKNDVIFYDLVVDPNTGEMKDKIICPHCNAEINQKDWKHVTESYFDPIINQNITFNKQIPVLINYSIGKKRFNKRPDKFDLDLINKIQKGQIPYWFPIVKIPKGDKTVEPLRVGINYTYQFYTKRNLWVLAALYEKIVKLGNKQLLFLLSSLNLHINKMRRYQPAKPGGTPGLPNTLYISSLPVELSIFDGYPRKFRNIASAIEELQITPNIVNTQSATDLKNIPDCCIDYIFTDPPFGYNIMYSELNFLWESWLKIYTNNKSEAVINSSQEKNLADYKDLMILSFKEMYRILKPNRWITVEFHNTKASVWNAIQDSITKAGFIIAQVAVLDKQQGSFNQVTAPGAVEKDLVINAYKPRLVFEERFLKRAGANLEKEFIIEHLSHLPKEPNIERTEQMLFSKMLAHYIQHGYEIRFNARQFYALLRDNFKLIDGYWFLDNEISKYEEWKKANGLEAIDAISKGQQTLFVTDERSFLIWLYNYLITPKTYTEIYTTSRNLLSSSSLIEDQIPEPRQLLEVNFIFEDGKYRRPTTEAERDGIESRREKELQKAFEKILEQALSGSKKIKDIRKEAVAYGFTRCYQEKRFDDIITVAKKIDKEILENNSEINDFVEIATLKTGKAL